MKKLGQFASQKQYLSFVLSPLEGGKLYDIPNLFEEIVILLDDKPRSKYIVVLYL